MAIRIISIIILLMSVKTISAQFLYTSMNISMPITVNMIKIDKDLIFSKKSNAVYINDHKTQISTTTLGSGGFSIGASMRRINIELGTNISSKSVTYKVRYPLGAGIDKEYIGNISFMNFDFPLIIGTTFLNSSRIRPYIELGAAYSYEFGGSYEFYDDKSTIHEVDLYSGLLYNDSRSSINGVAGAGMKFGILFIIIKYNNRFTGLSKGSLSSYFSLNVKAVISKKTKSTKNYIHFEDK